MPSQLKTPEAKKTKQKKKRENNIEGGLDYDEGANPLNCMRQKVEEHVKSAGVLHKEVEKRGKKQENMNNEAEKLNELIKPVQTVKKSVDPKSTLCASSKCKLSHDLIVEKEADEQSLNVDMRDDEKIMETWSQGFVLEKDRQRVGKTDIVSLEERIADQLSAQTSSSNAKLTLVTPNSTSRQSTLVTLEFWKTWFMQARVSEQDSIEYANIFVNSGMKKESLSNIDEDKLDEMGIKRLGDVIRILERVKKVKSIEQNASAIVEALDEQGRMLLQLRNEVRMCAPYSLTSLDSIEPGPAPAKEGIAFSLMKAIGYPFILILRALGLIKSHLY